MDEEQLALIKKYNLVITHIRTEYNLCVPICIDKIIGCKINKHVLIAYEEDGKRYTIDICSDGNIIIYRATDKTFIITILSEIIKRYDIVYDKPLDVTKLNIIGIRCEGKLLHDIYMNLILSDYLETTRSNSRVYYTNSNVSITKAGVVINSDSYDLLIHICKHISASAPVVLFILHYTDNSLFYTIPVDVIHYILQYIII